MADAAFFDVYAGPFSEGAALVGLLLVAAGVVYLGRGWRATVSGLALAGSGGFLAILSKEQYLVLAAPICLTMVLASADGIGSWRALRRFRNRQWAAAVAVAALLAIFTAGYLPGTTPVPTASGSSTSRPSISSSPNRHQQANAPAELRALGLPASWARYAGHYYWDSGSVRTNPTLPRYYGQLTDTNIAHYLITHPGRSSASGSAPRSRRRSSGSPRWAITRRLRGIGRAPGVPGSGGDVADAPAAGWARLRVVHPSVGLHGRGSSDCAAASAPRALAPGRRRDGGVHDACARWSRSSRRLTLPAYPPPGTWSARTWLPCWRSRWRWRWLPR